MPTESNPPKVFISYSHDSRLHLDRVLELADRLRAEGIDCNLDQYEPAPAEGWPRWMDKQFKDADFILVICTEIYCRRFEGREEPGKGLGVKWEGAIITDELYSNESVNKRFIPLLFSKNDTAYVPQKLQHYMRHLLAEDEGYEELYRRLTNQPRVVKPPLGKRRSFEPVNKLRSLPSEDRQQEFVPIQQELHSEIRSDKVALSCSECGAPYDANDPYCGDCGSWLETHIISAPPPLDIQVVPPPEPQPPYQRAIKYLDKGANLEVMSDSTATAPPQVPIVQEVDSTASPLVKISTQLGKSHKDDLPKLDWQTKVASPVTSQPSRKRFGLSVSSSLAGTVQFRRRLFVGLLILASIGLLASFYNILRSGTIGMPAEIEIIPERLNVRGGPSSQFKPIGVIAKGSHHRVLEKNEQGWLRIEVSQWMELTPDAALDAKEGWIAESPNFFRVVSRRWW